MNSKSGRKRPCAHDVIPSDDEIIPNPKKTEVHSHTEDVPENVDINDQDNNLPVQELTCEDGMFPNDYDSQDYFMPSPSPTRYFDDGNDLPGTLMFQEKPVEVSKQMQHVVSENHNIFDSPPIGPLYTVIPDELTSYLPGAFLHSYVLTSYKDKSMLQELFQQQKECCPNTFVVCVETTEDTMIYDVLDDPTSICTTLNSLKTMNPLIANLLIDYFEVQKWSTYVVT